MPPGAQIAVEMTGRERGLTAALNSSEAQIKKLKHELKETTEVGARGAHALSHSIREVGAEFISAVGPATLLLGVMQKIGAEREKAKAEATAAEGATGKILQIAKSQSDARRMFYEADRELFGQGGAGSRGQARSIVGSLATAHLDTQENRRMFSRLYGIYGDIEAAAPAIGKITASLGGDARGLFSKSLAASRSDFSSDTGANILTGVSKEAAQARMAGISIDTLFTLTAGLAKKFGGAVAAGDEIDNTIRAIQKSKRFRGTDPMALADITEAWGPDKFKKEFGERRGQAVRMVMEGIRDNRGTIAQIGEAVGAAVQRDELGGFLARAEADPTVNRARMDRQTKAMQELERETAADLRLKSDRAIANTKRRMAEEGYPIGAREGYEFIAEKVKEFVPGGESMIVAGERGRSEFGQRVMKPFHDTLIDDNQFHMLNQSQMQQLSELRRNSHAMLRAMTDPLGISPVLIPFGADRAPNSR